MADERAPSGWVSPGLVVLAIVGMAAGTTGLTVWGVPFWWALIFGSGAVFGWVFALLALMGEVSLSLGGRP